jgi:hypothetical protein
MPERAVFSEATRPCCDIRWRKLPTRIAWAARPQNVCYFGEFVGRATMLQSISTIPTDLLWLALAFVVVMAGMLAAAPE